MLTVQYLFVLELLGKGVWILAEVNCREKNLYAQRIYIPRLSTSQAIKTLLAQDEEC